VYSYADQSCRHLLSVRCPRVCGTPALFDCVSIASSCGCRRESSLAASRRPDSQTKAAVPSLLFGEHILCTVLSSKRVQDTDATVVSSLTACLPVRRNTFKANHFVLYIIEYGYTLPFLTKPPSAYAVNIKKSALDHPDLVQVVIDQHLLSRLVQKISNPAHCWNPLPMG
jgi:hypothetical protein